MSPLDLVVTIAAGASAAAWLASLATGDTSWVDRLWSIVPEVYVGVFALRAGLHDARLDLMAVLTTLWGIRLTYNFARKGGYRGVEDYRWAVLRQRMSPRRFQFFNLFFIVLYQNALLVLITLPALTAFDHRRALGPLDVTLAAAFLLCLVGETVADQQQWRFQSSKSREVAAGRAPAARFCRSGLFRVSRHPNYFFELAQWWILFLLGAAAARSLAQWTVVGPALLTALFAGSTRFTEAITLSRYPEYAEYQRRTSAIIPWFASRRAPSTRG